MQAAVSARDTYKPSLLHLLTEVGSDGRAVKHFVCLDCLQLVDRPDGIRDIHACPAGPPPVGSAGDDKPQPATSSVDAAA